MAYYKTRDLLNRLHEIYDDGYPLVEVSLMEADDDFPESLHFDATEPESYECVDYEEVESCEDPDNPDSLTFTIHPDDPCHQITFTYSEIDTIFNAVGNALEYFKQESKNRSNPRETLDEIKATSIRCRNLQAKLIKFLKNFDE